MAKMSSLLPDVFPQYQIPETAQSANRCENNLVQRSLLNFMLSWQKSCVISVENQRYLLVILLRVYETSGLRSGDVVAHRSLRQLRAL